MTARLAAVTAQAGPIAQIAIACIDTPPEAPLQEHMPCGACRQWLADLAPDAEIYIDGSEHTYHIVDLLPFAFRL
jgi:cytidine deaminase